MSRSVDDTGQQFINGRRRGGSPDPALSAEPRKSWHDTVFTG